MPPIRLSRHLESHYNAIMDLSNPSVGDVVVLAPGYKKVEDAGASAAALKPGLEGLVERVDIFERHDADGVRLDETR